MTMDSFTGKLAVVTGGGSGMGRELTRQLAAQGCSVAACDLNPDTMAETVALVRAEAPPGVLVTGYTCASYATSQVCGSATSCSPSMPSTTSIWSSAMPGPAAAGALWKADARSGSASSPSTGGVSTTAPARSCRC